ncbi:MULTISPECIES: hypothetical protein [unclassified Yoonia]|uniref:hypothetical protein n=1 Tax=unclassified Yoonia TaxID=2629118 RepID=UPI002AFF5AF5|nr:MULTISPECIES: hypothetical protein [unclassified Yoonia]
MSHSENNVDRQVKRHKGPLYGMIAVVVFAAVLLFWWLGTEVDEAPGMEGEAAPASQTSPDQTTGTDPIIDGETTPVETTPVPGDTVVTE